MPRVWGSHYNSSGLKNHPYNPSSTGDFALKPYGQSRGDKVLQQKDQSMHDTAASNSHSDETTYLGVNSQGTVMEGHVNPGFVMRNEFTTAVSGPSDRDRVAPFR